MRGSAGGEATRALGRRGENLAAHLLRGAGYRILDRNWRAGRYEIDLVCVRKREVVFVEVKTRRPGPHPPSESLTPVQRRNINRAASAWMRSHPGIGTSFRFDLVAITWPETGRPRVRHIVGAFQACGA